MSVKVELGEIGEALAGVGDTCFLLTTNADRSPHPANVRFSFDGDRFTLSAGRRSCRNSHERPTITLLWPAVGARAMSLLVDGTATVDPVDDGVVSIEPTSAIWHRQPE